MTLIKPLITEKSIRATSRGVFTFQTTMATSKHQVRSLVESLFKVNVVKLTTRLTHVPAKRTGAKRLTGNSQITKLVNVTLKPGQTIALFDIKDKS